MEREGEATFHLDAIPLGLTVLRLRPRLPASRHVSRGKTPSDRTIRQDGRERTPDFDSAKLVAG